MAKDLTAAQLAQIAQTRARLKEWREKFEPNRSAFAKKVGCTPGMIAFLESGEGGKLPGVTIAVAIERATHGAIRVEDWAPSTEPVEEPAA